MPTPLRLHLDPVLTRACPAHDGAVHLQLYLVTPRTDTHPVRVVLARPDTPPPAGAVLLWAADGDDAVNSAMDHDFIRHPVYPCTVAEWRRVSQERWPDTGPVQLISRQIRGAYYYDLTGRNWAGYSGGPPVACALCGTLLLHGGYGTGYGDEEQAICVAHVEHLPVPDPPRPAPDPDLGAIRQALGTLDEAARACLAAARVTDAQHSQLSILRRLVDAMQLAVADPAIAALLAASLAAEAESEAA